MVRLSGEPPSGVPFFLEAAVSRMNQNLIVVFYILTISTSKILSQDQPEVPASSESDEYDPCSGVSCSNKGLCVPNNVYSRGYWCECDDGWAGQDCKHPEPTVQCGDRHIDVVIDKGLVQELGIEDDADFVYFGRSTAHQPCRATEDNNLYKLSINAPFSSCGTQVSQATAGDDYTFSNTVVWNREVGNSDNLIDRELVLLDFKCIYEDTYTVSGPPVMPSINVLKLANEKGQFEVTMSLFTDDQFTRKFTSHPTVAIGTYVYVQVELGHIRGADLVVTMDRCFASQSGDPLDPISVKYMLIVDRCVSGDTTVQIGSNGETETASFKFQMFKWRWSADDVYLHCEVDICNKTNEVCGGEQANCKGSGRFKRKRRDAQEGVFDPEFAPHTGNIVSQGPIKVIVDEDSKWDRLSGDDESTSMLELSITVGVVLIALGVVVGAVLRRRWKQQRDLADKMLADANRRRLTSLEFRRESF